MKQHSLTWKIFLLIVLNDLGDCIARLLMKKGLAQPGAGFLGLGQILEFIAQNAGSGLVWLGILVYALNFFLWIAILSRVELSVAMPVGSTSYVIIPLVAMFFLGEKVSALRWVGILLIVAGIHFVAKSKATQPIAAVTPSLP